MERGVCSYTLALVPLFGRFAPPQRNNQRSSQGTNVRSSQCSGWSSMYWATWRLGRCIRFPVCPSICTFRHLRFKSPFSSEPGVHTVMLCLLTPYCMQRTWPVYQLPGEYTARETRFTGIDLLPPRPARHPGPSLHTYPAGKGQCALSRKASQELVCGHALVVAHPTGH